MKKFTKTIDEFWDKNDLKANGFKTIDEMKIRLKKLSKYKYDEIEFVSKLPGVRNNDIQIMEKGYAIINEYGDYEFFTNDNNSSLSLLAIYKIKWNESIYKDERKLIIRKD